MPVAVRGWVVEHLPWLVAVLLVLWVPPVATTVAVDLGLVAGRDYQRLTDPALALGIAEVVMMSLAIPGLRRRTASGWRWLARSRAAVLLQTAWSLLILSRLSGLGTALRTRSIVEAIGGLAVAAWLLIAIRPAYEPATRPVGEWRARIGAALGHPLTIVLGLAAAYRLTLLGRGAMAFVDETLYFAAVMALDALAHGHPFRAATAITLARGRQATAIVQLPLAAMQAIPAAFGVPASNLRSLLIPTLANVLVSLLILGLLYSICVQLCRHRASAVTATAVYAFLVNTNLYVRHLLPYDWSLLAGTAAVWLLIRRAVTPARTFAIGLLLGGVVGLYTGYYMLAAIVGVAAVGAAARNRLVRALACGAALVAGVAIVPAALEIVCRAGGVSYFASSQTLSRSINLGSFAEGWTFLPEYLVRVEGFSGVLLLSAVATAVGRSGWRAARGRPDTLDWLMLSGCGGWVLEALLSARWHVFVFYGRLIHPLMFLMAIALASTLAAVPASARGVVVTVVLVVAAIAWIPTASAFYQLSYPPDVLYRLGIDTNRVSPDLMICELTPGTSYASPGPLNRTTRFPYGAGRDYVLVNFCQGPPSGRLYVDAPGYRRIYDGPHWLTLPAYGYEGFTPEARAEIARGGYRVQAYAPDTAGRQP